MEPLPGSMNRVSVRAKKGESSAPSPSPAGVASLTHHSPPEGLEEVIQTESCLVSDSWLPTLARQKALQANVSAAAGVQYCCSL